MERQVPGAAGDPPLPQPRRRPLRPAPQHPVQHPGHRRPLRRGRPTAGTIETDQGDRVTAQFLDHRASAACRAGQIPNIPGRDTFEGESYHTGAWPHDGVDFTGKRVGVIGTGSSGVQSIPVIAKQAGHLYVFQRTPQYTIPARHGTVDKAFLDEVKTGLRRDLREGPLVGRRHARTTPIERSALAVSDEERQRDLRGRLAGGRLQVPLRLVQRHRPSTGGPTTPPRSSSARKIREIVKDPETSPRSWCPIDHPFTSKRALIDTNYFETYNRDNVTLVDIRHAPIEEITPTGIRTEDGEYELDIIVFATGFDAMTGTFNRIDIQRSRRREAEGQVGRTAR